MNLWKMMTMNTGQLKVQEKGDLIHP